MRKIRLLLIEDNRLLRDGLVAMMKEQPDLQIVSASESFDDAALVRPKLKPHVVLLDQCLRDQDSVHVVKIIKKKVPEAEVIVMGLVLARADILAFVKAGASGFILKDTAFADFLKTIRAVAEGGKALPLASTELLFSQIVEDAVRKGKVRPNDVRITKREREIVDLIGEGLSNKEMAQRLHLAIHTVKSHVHHVPEKLALHTRLQVAVYAREESTFEPQAKVNPPNAHFSLNLKD